MKRLRTLERLRASDLDHLPTGHHHDGGGLFLLVETTGARRWVQRLAINGKRVWRGLGPYPTVSLKMARGKAIDARRGAMEGKDVHQRTQTFAQAFEQHFAQRKEGLTNAEHIRQWRTSIEGHALPRIGPRPVADITHDEIISVVRPIWRKTPESARRLLQRMTTIFDITISRGFREKANPCTGVAEDLGRQGDRVAHHPALPYQEVPGFLKQLRASTTTKAAFEWLILTATRSGEARNAIWDEIKGDLWVIPGARMKAGIDHIVPLSSRCLEILREMRALYPSSPFLFPGVKRGAALSEMTFRHVLLRMRLAKRATAHGFRTSFRTWATETNACREVVAEAALAHGVKDKVEAAYRRTSYLEERVALMQAWAAYCGGGS
jgi:integrase